MKTPVSVECLVHTLLHGLMDVNWKSQGQKHALSQRVIVQTSLRTYQQVFRAMLKPGIILRQMHTLVYMAWIRRMSLTPRGELLERFIIRPGDWMSLADLQTCS